MIHYTLLFILTFCASFITSTKSRVEDYYCYTSGVLQGVPCRFFAIVFDAGSTGTRLHLYKYVHNTDRNGIPFKVEEEIFREAKPALSSFIDDPSAAGASIRPLLETAQAHVPLFMWEKTPITLKATAGLRLLPGDLADDILDAVEDVIASSGFFVVPDAVSIMSGSDEGMYSWFTLNLLLKNRLYSEFMLLVLPMYLQAKPALSSFIDDPSAAGASIRPLLETAQAHVPLFMWEKTPITLKATAGLRLLPGDLADDILDAVEDVIASSGFFVVPDAVSIMSGSDEGMYSWFTLNLLLNRLYSDDVAHPHHPEPSRSVAAFDLGGGSTQLTFWPEDRHMFDLYPEYERDIDFFGYRMRLFTHSFLGNGLVAARLNVLLELSGNENDIKSQLYSPCMPVDFVLQDWEYALKKWTIRGSPSYSFASCYSSTRSFIEQSDIMKLKALHGKTVYLFSYFFDRGLNAGLVKEHHGGLVKLEDFKVAAQKACSRGPEELKGFHWMPWQCHDLTYIYSLLHDGYGFDDSQPLFLAKKLKGMEVAWGLGLSYALVHEFHKSQKLTIAERGNATVVDQIMSFIYSGTNNFLSYLNIIS
ncbi:GDA1/CD39 family protein [Ostertagia ostertagi]